MSELLHELISRSAATRGESAAIHYKGQAMSYRQLEDQVNLAAAALLSLDLLANERVAVYLPKRFETVIAMFGASKAGGVFVPINPLLKAEQASYICKDCNVRILVTMYDRATQLMDEIHNLPDLHTIVLIDGDNKSPPRSEHVRFVGWSSFIEAADRRQVFPRIDTDMTAILYTSGSTGKPKGVVLSHKNMVTGAKSVASYLENTADDKLLAVLPFSFDYGLSQLTTAFNVGASAVLMDYLFPKDVVSMVSKEKITGLAAVPPLWAQIADLEWPQEAKNSLRYITNSGGAMPVKVLNQLREQLPSTSVFLMYGLTEAFRSSYLHPSEIDKRPDSMGKAIPNTELMVVREDGTPCAANEPGELVHRGSLVAMGYWNDPEKTAERFKPLPQQLAELPIAEIAVWSGDTVRMDEEGYLYFIGRKDDMIKTSGYRVSPTEVEEVIYASGLVEHVAVIGVPHPVQGQGIIAVVTAGTNHQAMDTESIVMECKRKLPAFMVPLHIEVRQSLSKNPNGKIDRKVLVSELQHQFSEDS